MTEQQSPEWFLSRLGFATASRAKDILATIKSGEAAARRDYKMQLVTERLTGVHVESFTNAAIEWGTEQEPFARMKYEAMTGNIVMESGFIKHGNLMAGASPDGVIDADGMVEIKCPKTSTHVDTLLNGMSSQHIPQMQFQMWITGRQWNDFVSFDPRLPEHLKLYVQRIVRDEEYIKNLESEVMRFLEEVDEMVSKLTELKGKK